VSAGHTTLGIQGAEDAVRRGVGLITHLYNAMTAFHHRDPGLPGLLSAEQQALRVPYGIIADGIHTHPWAVSTAFRTHPKGCVLVTDAMSALGLGVGKHHIGNVEVLVKEVPAWGRPSKALQATKAGTDILAGAVLDLYTCFRNLISFTGCTLAEAAECVSLHPAKAVGASKKGSLEPGYDADFLLIDPDTLDLRETWVGGHCVWTSSGSIQTCMPTAQFGFAFPFDPCSVTLQQRRMGRGVFLGINFNGSALSVGVVDDLGQLVGNRLCDRFRSDVTATTFVARVKELSFAALETLGCKSSDLDGVGVGVPGFCDFNKGMVLWAVNLQCWKNVPLLKLVSEALAVPVSKMVLENDANVELLGEMWIGAANGKKSAVLIALGAGVGGAVMCDGKMLHGKNGSAAELGHMILVPNGCDGDATCVEGTLEAYASESAVVSRCCNKLPSNSSLSECSPTTFQDVLEHAARGDEHAKLVLSEAVKHLAVASINCTWCFNPEIILFTGWVARAGDRFLAKLQAEYGKYHASGCVELALGNVGECVGVVGAAFAAFRAQSPVHNLSNSESCHPFGLSAS